MKVKPITQRVDEEKKKAVECQRKYPCMISGCEQMGRKLAEFKRINQILSYCPKHRILGERIINRIFIDMIKFETKEFIEEGRSKLINNNELDFCDDCVTKIKDYIKTKMNKAFIIHDLEEQKEGEYSDDDESN